eukprot:965024-Amorphochlora_amoeboformis.AAC.1
MHFLARLPRCLPAAPSIRGQLGWRFLVGYPPGSPDNYAQIPGRPPGILRHELWKPLKVYSNGGCQGGLVFRISPFRVTARGRRPVDFLGR